MLRPGREGSACWLGTAEVGEGGSTGGYVEATFIQQSGERLCTVELSSGKRCDVDPGKLHDANPGPSVPDLTTMVVLNEATILNNVRERYQRDRIYTRASNMLVAVNPGKLLREVNKMKCAHTLLHLRAQLAQERLSIPAADSSTAKRQGHVPRRPIFAT